MRWQKVARLAIALFVIAFAGFVFLAMRHRVAPAPGKPAVTGADPEAIMESGAGERRPASGPCAHPSSPSFGAPAALGAARAIFARARPAAL